MDPKDLSIPSLKDLKSKARVGLLGGSFDPPHLSHQLLALSFKALLPIDELWIIPCANHAFKPALLDFDHRFAMCKLAFDRIRGVRVVDIERNLPSPSFTIQTIRAIKKQRPDLDLVLCIGSDLIDTFHQWHEAQEIVDTVHIAIFERAAYPIKILPKLLEKAEVHRGYALPDTASTNVRELFLEHMKNKNLPFLDRDVFHYIERHKLYKK